MTKSKKKFMSGRWITVIVFGLLTAWVVFGGLYGTTDYSYIPQDEFLQWGIPISGGLLLVSLVFAIYGDKKSSKPS
jgi:hypothetical protein